MIDRGTIDKVLETAQIYDVVSEFVSLKKAGAGYKGLCPFHDDRSPSFIVTPARNMCKCFACGEGGGPVQFLMKHEQISFPDAIKWLGRRYGIPVVEKVLTAEEKAQENERDSMLILNDWALEWFEQQMYDTPEGRAIGMSYFRERGFRDDIIKRFQLGFCPREKDRCTQAAIKAGYNEEYLVKTGISIRRDNGSLYDRYHGRVMFPIHNVSGRVVGFGGRVLDAATKGVAVKYQNSPESVIYNKRKELYGLYQAKKAITKLDMVFMVEGYTDVISMHQAGIENVVANSGTALTKEQIYLLRRFTNNITLLYDGDAAGIKAANRGTDMFLAMGMNVKILLLPNGDDPDSFARKHNEEEFRRYVEEHQVDFIRFKTNLLLQQAQGDPIKLRQLAGEIIVSIACIPDDITRSLYIRQASQALNIDERLLYDDVVRQRRKNAEEAHKAGTATERNADSSAQSPTAISTPSTAPQVAPASVTERPLPPEDQLATLIIKYGGKVAFCGEDDEGNPITLTVAEMIDMSLQQDELQLRNPLYRQILDEAVCRIGEGSDFDATRYFANHQDQRIASLVMSIELKDEPLSKYHNTASQEQTDEERLYELTIRHLSELKLAIITEQINALKKHISDPTLPDDKAMAILAEFKEKMEIKAELSKLCGERVLG